MGKKDILCKNKHGNLENIYFVISTDAVVFLVFWLSIGCFVVVCPDCISEEQKE